MSRVFFRYGAPALFLSAATVARAEAVFPAGVESKARGLESSLGARGAPSVLYNPANLVERDLSGLKSGGEEPYAELGIANVIYSYEHPEFDPVRVTVNTPIATLGHTGKIGERVRYGVVVFPSKNGKTEIPGLPRKVGSTVTALEVEAEDRVIDLGAGLGFRINDHAAVGMATVRTFEDHVLEARLVGNENSLTQLNYKNQFQTAVVGTRFTPRRGIDATLAYRPAKSKSYKGTQYSAGSPERSSSKVVNYEPEVVSIGASGVIGPATVGIDVNKRYFGRGKSVFQTGLSIDKPNADLKDVVEFGVATDVELPWGASAGVGYARLPSPWGDGVDDGELDHHVQGVDYGHLNGVDRQSYSLYGEGTLRGASLGVTLLHSRGERAVGGSGDNLGFYSLGVTTLSGVVRVSF